MDAPAEGTFIATHTKEETFIHIAPAKPIEETAYYPTEEEIREWLGSFNGHREDV